VNGIWMHNGLMGFWMFKFECWLLEFEQSWLIWTVRKYDLYNDI